MRKDSLALGILLGIIAPVAGMLVYYLIQFRQFTLVEFFTVMFQQKSLLSAIVSISLIANAVVFTLFINKHQDKTARGIFIITCVYAIVALLYRLLG